MRRSKIKSSDFNVPLECNERNEILRYVSQNKSFDSSTTGATPNRKERSRRSLEPPSKFSFLSGIHPDLDEALCEIQSPNSRTIAPQETHDAKRRLNDVTTSIRTSKASPSPSASQGKTTSAIFDDRRRSSSRGKKHINGHSTIHERGRNDDDKSKENLLLQDEFERNEYKDVKPENSISGSTANNSYLGGFGSRIIDERGSDSAFDSESSKPKEITCGKDIGMGMNESVDSLPFSVDGMERAKRRIKSQADKIRDLEAKLEKAAAANQNNEIEQEKHGSSKNIMSPEERLQAHKERKRNENKYKEKSGKWGAPPTIKNENLTSKVKRKDKLVDRLVADPKLRKKQEEESKKLRRSLQRFEKCTSDDDDFDEPDGSRSPVIRSNSMKKKKKKSKRNNIKAGGTMPNNLMERLNMSVKERRKTKKSDDQIPDNLRRALQGHRMQKKSWRMSQEFDNENSLSSSSEEGGLDYNYNSDLKEHIQCETCSLKTDCEEDADNPGIYYCRKCWEEYDVDQYQEKPTQSFIHDEFASCNENSSCYSEKNKSPRQESIHDKINLYDEALWIIHDNPKLGGRLTCSGLKKMSCLIETKDPLKKNCVRILLGQIDYCGAVIGSGIRNQTVKETDRGAECLRVSNIRGFFIDHDEVETRLTKNKSIYEFKLDTKKSTQLTGIDAQVRLKDFLEDCKGAVDVILAPQCLPGGWYPQREAASNFRKIAPQFRSNGLGYIRLGDDMGKNGLAFLSSDLCQSFFSTPEAVNQSTHNNKFLKKTSSFASSHRSKSNISGNAQALGRKRSVGLKSRVSQHDCLGVDEENFSQCSSSSVSSCDDDNEESTSADTLLKELQNLEVSKNVKWNEKAELLLRLGKALEKPQGRGACSNTLNYIQDIISAKNVNINVLRNALSVVERIGDRMKEELVYHIGWKTIFIEILKLLKNKRVANGTKQLLGNLHGKCFTLANSIVAVSHVLGMGNTNTNHRKSMSSIKQVPSGNKSSQSMQKSNNVEVIEWLAVSTETERTMEAVHPMIDEGGLAQLAIFFSSHESHRDASCRKNALDGMLHTVIYGIDRLEMDKSDALKLCIDLKTLNPRSWTRLTKGVNQVLKDCQHKKKR